MREQQSLRILVVDDNAAHREVAVALISSRGLRVDVAANGSEAVDAFQRNSYSLILMDLEMPVMDGYEAARQIRLLEKGGPRVPIIAWSLWAADLDEGEYLRAGMDGYLGKPTSPADFRGVIERWLPREPLE